MAATSARTRRGVTGRDEAPEETGTVSGSEETGTDSTEAGETTEETAETEGGEEAVTDPWAVLGEATEAVEFVRPTARKDWEKEAPERIRLDMKKSFAGYKPRVVEGEVIEGKGELFWMVQRFPTIAMAGMYLDIARKYCAFKEWTIRSYWMEEVDSGEGRKTLVRSKEPQSKILRFCVKPRESRKS